MPGADFGLTFNAVHLIVPGTADVVNGWATSDAHNRGSVRCETRRTTPPA